MWHDTKGIDVKMRMVGLLMVIAGMTFLNFGAESAEVVVNKDNIGHARHRHRHNPPHETTRDPARFWTSRSGAKLNLPVEQDAFFFVVFGDRTGGPAKGVSVLADAVRDTNLLEPDLVMTVGDLIQGYSEQAAWLEQMEEFKGIMDELICPWFPVAGNHDTYWRGPKGKKPVGEHDESFEKHFGPLWYAFEHKNCWFIALYSDEGNPETGEKSFRKPECQTMSPAQFEWLASVLKAAKDADHIFLFLHHPRWLRGGYGDDWDKVHQLLLEAGNVSAVFGGHIHRMRSDPRDGIEYVTLATVGGGQSGFIPSAGYLHQFHIVTVRKQQIAIASIPVGDIMDVREITGSMQEECLSLATQQPEFSTDLKVDLEGNAQGQVCATMMNTSSRPIDITALLESEDNRWRILPDHGHVTLDPEVTHEFVFEVQRVASPVDVSFRSLELVTQMEYLTDGYRYPIPEQRLEVPIEVELQKPDLPANERALILDGAQGHVSIASSRVPLPDGPLTLECWMRGHNFGKRVGLLAKTESSDYGIFVSRGEPHFSIFLDDKYVTARPGAEILKKNRWYHVAGVFDGCEVRLYVDGQLVGVTAGNGKRRTNNLPLIIGADVNGRGRATSHFDGMVDEIRLSATARYSGEQFMPQRRFHADESTLLLFHADGDVGRWIYDSSSHQNHAPLSPGAVVGAVPE